LSDANQLIDYLELQWFSTAAIIDAQLVPLVGEVRWYSRYSVMSSSVVNYSTWTSYISAEYFC